MSARSKQIAALILAGVLAAGWYWWTRPSPESYGGVKGFMKTMKQLHEATAAVITEDETLPLDFIEMEQLSQSAQDVFVVFQGDDRLKDPRFSGLAAELMRRGTQLEQAWDDGNNPLAKERFRLMTEACNACHTQLGGETAPQLKSPV